MKGILIYNSNDYFKNTVYADWLIREANLIDIQLFLVFEEDFLTKGFEINKNNIKFAINRSRNFQISLILELNNIRVFNNSNITLLGNNKLAAYKYAKEKNVDYPTIYASWDYNNKVISKLNSGHGGIGVTLLNNDVILPSHDRIQQEYVANCIGDIRFYILNNTIIHCVLRKPKSGIVSNFSMGGSIEQYKYTHEELRTVEKLIAGLNIDYAGVDFLLTNENKLLFNEIEDVVGSRMLSALGINDTSTLFLSHIKNSLYY